MVKLYPHQRKAIDELHNGCILQGGTGSGKSLTSLCYYYEKILNGSYTDLRLPTKKQDLLIITTAKKRDSREWIDDLFKAGFGIKDNYVEDFDIHVTIDSWNNITKYENVKNLFIIFDEQKISGYGKWSKTFIKMSKYNEWILLSATPGDTWSDYIPVFIANGFYHNKTEFNNRHVVFKPYMNYPVIDHYVDISRLIRYRDFITVKMDFVRETKQIHKYITVDYDKNKYFDTLKNRWDYDTNEPIENISSLCAKLRKISNSSEDRILALKSIIENLDRGIIFYNFDYELILIRQLLESIDKPYAEWNGHKHQKLPVTKNWIYIVNYAAGSEAWNCVTTDTIIFFSQTYSYKSLIQSCGRIDRLNTPYKELYYYHLISSSPIDKAIQKNLKNKKEFNENKFMKGVYS